MKKLIIVILCLLFSSLFAETASEQATQAYQQHHYKKASQLWEQQVRETGPHPELFYQIANAYWRNANAGKATLYYLRCLRYNSAHRSAAANLSYVRSLSKDAKLYQQQSFLSRHFESLLAVMNLNRLAMAELLLFIATITLIYLILLKYRRQDNTILLLYLSIALFLLVMNSTLSIIKYERFANDHTVVLLIPSATAYSGPDDSFSPIVTLHEGCSMERIKQEGNWIQVKLPNGLGAWIQAEGLEAVRSELE